MQHATTSTALSMLQSMFPNKMRIGTVDLATVLDLHPQTIRNAVAEKSFKIPTYLDGHLRYADLRDVADYLDKKRNAKPMGRPTKASRIAAAQASAHQ